MLYITFQIGQDDYALDTSQVVEVLPLVNVKRIPGAVKGIAGIFNYHGAPVPLIDLNEMAMSQPSAARMSTRIILVRYAHDPLEPHLLGLMAEHVTRVVRLTDEDFVESGVNAGKAPYLGPITMDTARIIQKIDINRLLPEKIRTLLF